MSKNVCVNLLRIVVQFDIFFSFLFPKALISGVVVNTCGYIRQEGYESFKHVAKTFDGSSRFFNIQFDENVFSFVLSFLKSILLSFSMANG